MRHVLLGSAFLIATILLAAPSSTNAATWCLMTRQGGDSLCRYRTFEQCMASKSSVGDSCYQHTSPATRAASPQKRNKTSGTEERKKATPRTAEKPQPEPAKVPEQPVKQAVPVQTPVAPTPAAQAAAARNFAAARDLVLSGKYEAGITALRALGFDQHPDVAAYVGLAHYKLGRVDEARSWYAKALAGNPKHLLTLSYDGMMRAEQGDLAKAQANLDTIKGVCGGTTCREYIALDAMITSKRR
jgi:hypothetical protein